MTVLLSSQAFACDDILKPFSRDCKIQDDFREIQTKYRERNLDVNQVYEYKLLRFIDRKSFEKALVDQTPVEKIYEPSPDTWNFWSKGIEYLLDVEFQNIFFKQKPSVSAKTQILFEAFSLMNSHLLISNQSSFRQMGELSVGFCMDRVPWLKSKLNEVENSFERFQQQLEYEYQQYFSDLAVEQGVRAGHQFQLKTVLKFYDELGNLCVNADLRDQTWVSYIESYRVDQYLHWLKFFLEFHMDLIEQKKSALSPIELAAFVQKWFVTIHPFKDGNGRTSRALQDMILQHYGLPLAPAGDLQNDLFMNVEDYLESNFRRIEDSLEMLKSCSSQEIEQVRCQILN